MQDNTMEHQTLPQSTQPQNEEIIFTRDNKPLLNLSIIDLVETNSPPFWAYYNYAYNYRINATRYLRGNKEYYKHSKNEDDELVNSLGVKHDDTLKFNLLHSYPFDIFGDNFETINTGNGHLIGCFSAIYKLSETNIGDINYYSFIPNRLTEIEIAEDFEKIGLFPNQQQLDLVVKYYLKNIEPDLCIPFFKYHCNSYEGDIQGFIEHSIKITKEIWSVNNAKNIRRKKCFDFWLNENSLDSFNLTESQKLKGYDLGYSDEQLTVLHTALIDKEFLEKESNLEHFKNAFNGKKLTNFEKLKWLKSYYASIFVCHYVEHKTPWQIAERVFTNGTSNSLKNAYKPDNVLLSDNQKNAKELLDRIFKSLP